MKLLTSISETLCTYKKDERKLNASDKVSISFFKVDMGSKLIYLKMCKIAKVYLMFYEKNVYLKSFSYVAVFAFSSHSMCIFFFWICIGFTQK